MTVSPNSNQPPESIAIIGMAGRFPGARDINQFWRNLKAGIDSITHFTSEELAAAGIDGTLLNDTSNYVKAAGVLEEAEYFDAPFFNMPLREAQFTDPQHRIMLEVAWEALEDAGYDPDQYESSIGVYAGKAKNTYLYHYLSPYLRAPESEGDPLPELGNEPDYLCTRISYALNLKGPSVCIHTACSTSLVAIYYACQGLFNFECDIALSGGVCVRVPQKRGYMHQEGNLFSPDGLTRSFDHRGEGTLFTNGAGMIVLKRLSDALADGDSIYAVIRGIAINNDGSDKVSFMAPSVAGQAEVITMAMADAGVQPEMVSYVEGHGTATPLGDPIEVEALTQAFRTGTDKKGFCALGSVKSNAGHLEAAAGVAGVIKTALSLKHRLLPPVVHFEKPNPKFDIENTPFFINTSLREWSSSSTRIAGVSSFGAGGTNAHAILQEAPPPFVADASRKSQLLILSAKTDSALEKATDNLTTYLADNPDCPLADVAFTLQTGRRAFNYRRILVAHDVQDALTILRSRNTKHLMTSKVERRDRPVAFMFPGQGSQYTTMFRDVYISEPVFRKSLDHCSEILRPFLNANLIDVLYPNEDARDKASHELEQTAYAQPAVFSVAYSLAQLWMEWDINPDKLVGHSLGEYVSACLADVLSLEDALKLVSIRGQLMQTLPPGAMLAVSLSEEEAMQLTTHSISLAAVNGPARCVLSGPRDEINDLRERLEEKNCACQLLHTSHAFHSGMLEPIISPFEDELRKINLAPPQIPYISSLSGTWITADQAVDPAYWTQQMRQPVRFADALRELAQHPELVLLEVGPGSTLTKLAKHPSSKIANQSVITSLGSLHQYRSEIPAIMQALGQLWLSGVPVNWPGFYTHERRARVHLPTYPFERKPYWVDPALYQYHKDERAECTITSKKTSEDLKRSAVTPHIEHSVYSEGSTDNSSSRKNYILDELKRIVSKLSGVDANAIDTGSTFMELGFDSLFLTQASTSFKRAFAVKITFRQLLENTPTLNAIAEYLVEHLPENAFLPPSAPPGHPGPEEHYPSEVPITPSQPVNTSKSFGPWKPFDNTARSSLNEKQQNCLNNLITRYNEKTKTSKEITQKNRSHFADPRTASGFNKEWKEMVYPLVAVRSSGSRMWDIDGNEYVDIQSGFSSVFFGHNPDFIRTAIEQQLKDGVQIGPQSQMAGDVAKSICELTGMDRVTFCNTGSEAVLAAMRLARTVTGNNVIATFSNDYHGIFDEVLVRGSQTPGQYRSIPASPGIPAKKVENIVVLEYGNPESLKILEKFAGDLAAVLVEPVQSRNPDLQPKEFLHHLRGFTKASQIPLIFDEVITGFRLRPGGAQEWYDIHADMATYGKIVGGGMPIGVLAGKKEYMDALDGGMWHYGDNSFPEIGVTYFAGTFIRHPLAIAAARAVFKELKKNGNSLHDRLNNTSAHFADNLNEHFQKNGVPLHLQRCGSMFFIEFMSASEYSNLFYFLLRDKGIYILEGGTFYLTTAHSEQDLLLISEAFKKSASEMLEAEFLLQVPSRNNIAMTDEEQSAPHKQTPALEKCPLTDSQTEIWFAAQMGDDISCAYNEPYSLRLHGRLNVDYLHEAINKVFLRHQALHLTFSPDGNYQQTAPPKNRDLPFHDFSSLSEEMRQKEIAGIIDRESATPFDFLHGPLVRLQLIKQEADDHLLFIYVHHIVCDGWSAGILINELSKVYTALCRGLLPDLPVPIPFTAYALQEKTLQSNSDAEDALLYWNNLFSDTPPMLELPLDRKRPPVRTFNGSTVKFHFSSVLYGSLKKYAQHNNTTLFVTLLSAFKVLLYRLTGQEDIVLGISVAGQAMSGMTEVVGHCVNMLPLRSRCEADSCFSDFLKAVRSGVMDAYDHSNCSFGSILRSLKLDRDPSRAPLVEVIFNLSTSQIDLSFDAIKTRIEINPRRYVHADMFLNILEEEDGLTLDWEYNTDLLEKETIMRWVNHFETLLRAIVIDSHQSVVSLPLLSSEEKNKLLTLHHASPIRHSVPDKTPKDFFEEQAKRTPSAPAVSFKGKTITYQMLNRRANKVAKRLRQTGVGPDILVALCAERSIDLVVGVLAIIKAGGAYVPLDPSYPLERLKFMLDDIQAPVLLTQQSLIASLPPHSAETVCLDAPEFKDADNDPLADENSDSTVQPDNLAYVIYTSGSTGIPKGVMVTNANVIRLFTATQSWFNFSSNDVWTLFHSFAFDFSVWELFGALLYGGRLVVVPYLVSRSPEAFYKLLAEEKVTLLNQTPAAFRQLIRTEETTPVLPDLSLRFVIFGGEALDLQSLQPWAKRHGDTAPRLINMYGITETTVHVTYRPLSLPDIEHSYRSLIGVPIPDLKVYVLDNNLQPVPLGVSGELYVGGAGLARGYLNRPELTRERFIPDPYSTSSGDRLYKTGDLARLLPDGDLEYLGRNDNQVKVRGFRIELAEIENVVLKHTHIREAVVMAYDDTLGTNRLVAYLTTLENIRLSPSELRDFLKKDLPEYMIPSQFVFLNSMPLTKNGKIDRKALLTHHDTVAHDDHWVAPETPVQKELAAIWTSVLSLEKVGLHDNFFEIGGHSLLVIQMISRVRESFGLELSLRTVFETPTLLDLAQYLEEQQHAASAKPSLTDDSTQDREEIQF